MGLQLRGQSGTCVDGEASLADEQLRADGSAGVQPVQPLGDPQEPAGGIDPVQEAVHQEHHGRGRTAVPGQDGGLQISLKKTPQASSGKLASSGSESWKIFCSSNPIPHPVFTFRTGKCQLLILFEL